MVTMTARTWQQIDLWIVVLPLFHCYFWLALCHMKRQAIIAVVGAALVVFLAMEYQHLTATSYDPGYFGLMAFNYGAALILRYLADVLTKPSHKALDDAMGGWRSEVQYACVKAGIAETLSLHGPLSVEGMGHLLNITHVDNLQRLLRAAESMGYFREDLRSGLWHHSRLSEVLHPEHPLTVSHMIRHWKEDSQTAWSMLYEAIVDDTRVFEQANGGQTFWEILQATPSQEIQFQAAMTNQDALSTFAITYDFPHWSRFHRIIDYGGGHGGQLLALLERFTTPPSSSSAAAAALPMEGVLFDQPQVIEAARERWVKKKKQVSSSVFGRTTMIGGSFFELESLPVFREHDGILVRTVLHDWSDEEAIDILRTLRQRIGSLTHVTVLLSEVVVEAKDPLAVKFFLDLHMKISFHHAKERYLSQWKHIIEASGFALVNVHMIRAVSSILELRPV